MSQIDQPASTISDANRGRQVTKSTMSLWGKGKSVKDSVTGFDALPTMISGILTPEQINAYQAMFRIQEISHQLQINELTPPPLQTRSESPPPVYDFKGRRTNTREQRYKKKLEEERHRLVEIALKMIPHYVAPDNYKRPSSFQEKYYIPVSQYPEVNFVGLLLGPRGNTLKKLQEDSGCKIAIRGRGSVKEGKSASDLPKGAMNFADPLHCLITADSEEKVQKGIKCCTNVIVKALTSPEGQNDLKRGQLRELAELNGTLREDNRPCPICGIEGHKRYDCPNKETFAQRVVCRRCGNSGHTARDCNQPNTPYNSRTDRFNTPNRWNNPNQNQNMWNSTQENNNFQNNNHAQPVQYSRYNMKLSAVQHNATSYSSRNSRFSNQTNLQNSYVPNQQPVTYNNSPPTYPLADQQYAQTSYTPPPPGLFPPNTASQLSSYDNTPSNVDNEQFSNANNIPYNQEDKLIEGNLDSLPPPPSINDLNENTINNTGPPSIEGPAGLSTSVLEGPMGLSQPSGLKGPMGLDMANLSPPTPVGLQGSAGITTPPFPDNSSNNKTTEDLDDSSTLTGPPGL